MRCWICKQESEESICGACDKKLDTVETRCPYCWQEAHEISYIDGVIKVKCLDCGATAGESK